MTELVFGLWGLVVAGFAAVFLGLRFPPVIKPLLAGYALRVAMTLIHHFEIWDVPGGRADAITYERRAHEWSQLDWLSFLAQFDPTRSYVYSWIGALIYKVFGQNPLLFTALNVFLGSVLIILTYRLAILVYDRRVALVAAWGAALFPWAIFSSAVLLREAVSVTLFMLGLVQTVKWIDRANLAHAASAMMAFAGATVFHGAWVFSFLGFSVVVVKTLFGRSPGGIAVRQDFSIQRVVSIVILLCSLGGIMAYAIGSGLAVGKVGALDELISDSAEVLGQAAREEALGGSAFPAFVANINPVTQPWAVPVRIGYFLFSPFPWDIRTARHLQGLVPAVVFMALALSIWRSRSLLRQNPKAQAVLIIGGVLICAFALGTTNIGTSIRHRSKFVFMLLALAAGPVWRRRVAARPHPASRNRAPQRERQRFWCRR